MISIVPQAVQIVTELRGHVPPVMTVISCRKENACRAEKTVRFVQTGTLVRRAKTGIV